MGFEHGHFKEVCTECGTIVAQCRCLHPWKYVKKTICSECKEKEEIKKKVDESTAKISTEIARMVEISKHP